MTYVAEREMNGRWKIDPKLAVLLATTVVGWVVSLVLAYGVVNAKIAVTETKVDQLQRDVTEMKADLKSLYRRP